MGFLLLFQKQPRAVDQSLMTGTVPTGVTFARLSGGQRVNASGVLANVASNMPRFDHNPENLFMRGLLIEPQKTNLLQQSGFSSAWYAEGGGVLSYTTSPAAPNGGQCIKLQGNGSAGICMNNYSNVSLSVGTSYVASCYVRKGTSRYSYLRLGDGNALYGVLFDLQNNVAVGSLSGGASLAGYGLIPAGNGWVRIWASFVSTGGGGYYTVRPGVADTGDLNFLSSATSGNGHFFGAQLEVGTKPSSYIPTTTSPVTRAADVYSFVIPRGVTLLEYLFDDGSRQTLSVSQGPYTIPETLSGFCISRISSCEA